MSQPEPRPPGNRVRLLALVVAAIALVSRRPVRRLPSGVDAEDLAAGYERSDISPTVVVTALSGLLLTLIILFVLVTAIGTAFTGYPIVIGAPPATAQPAPPAPRLEAQSGQSLSRYVAVEQQKLTTYRWVNRQAGIATIPINEAMDLVAQQGLPARSGAPSQTTAPSRASSGRVDQAYP